MILTPLNSWFSPLPGLYDELFASYVATMRTRVASLQQSPNLTVAFIRGLVEPVAVSVDAVLLSIDDVLDPRGDISRRLTLTPSPIDLDAPFAAAVVAAVDERDRPEMLAREVESLMNFLHLSTHGYRMQLELRPFDRILFDEGGNLSIAAIARKLKRRAVFCGASASAVFADVRPTSMPPTPPPPTPASSDSLTPMTILLPTARDFIADFKRYAVACFADFMSTLPRERGQRKPTPAAFFLAPSHLGTEGRLQLSPHDLLTREVMDLHREIFDVDVYTAAFDGRNDQRGPGMMTSVFLVQLSYRS